MKDLEIIDTRRLFRRNTEELIGLLEAISREQWSGSTCYPNWKVRDIAAHLLQTGLGRLSKQRDGFPSSAPLPPLSFLELLSIIENGNNHWEEMFAYKSPEVITSLLKNSEYELSAFIESLPLLETAPFSVSWAGEMVSLNWFDTAREWTERWHHHQQIREAVGASPFTRREFLFPVIDTLIRAVPWWYEAQLAAEGTEIQIHITGEAGGKWSLVRNNGKWKLYSGVSDNTPAATVELSDDTAWRFLTRTIYSNEAEQKMTFSGNMNLAKHFLAVKAIMMAG